MNREEFLALRRTGIGGSDVAAILGMSKYNTALDVYLDKVGYVENEQDNARLSMGRYFEEPILQWYCDTQDVTAVHDSRGRFVRHPEHQFLIGNIDLAVTNEHGDTWGVDAKNVHYRVMKEWGEEGSDSMPLDALMQGHHYLFLHPEYSKWDFVALLGGMWPPRIFSVVKSPGFYEEHVLPKVSELWQCVQDHTPPAPDFSDPKILDAIKALYPPNVLKADPVEIDSLIQIGDRNVAVGELCEAYKLLGAIEKEAESRKDRVDAALRARLGTLPAGRVGEVVVRRIYNKGGSRPATVIKPYDYLRVDFPKNHEFKITSARVNALLEGEIE